MNRTRLVVMAVLLVVALGVLWVVRNTEWGDVSVPSPLRGEAASNPFYAAQRLVVTLAGTSERRESLGDTSSTAAVVLSTWGWDIEVERRQALEQWVEAGGRLVVDAGLVSGSDAFERWSGVTRERVEEDPNAGVFRPAEVVDPCQLLVEIDYGRESADAKLESYEVCDFDRTSWLESESRLLWALDSDDALQAVRVAVGEGSVTVINGVPFVYRALFEGDHGELFAAATQLRAGDHIVFMSEDDALALPELVWRYGAPVVAVLLLWLALALWRGAVRFGPLVAVVERARRSLGEQILGTGRFVLRAGGGAALHAAATRALHEAASRRVASYARLSAAERTAAVARLAAVDGAALAAALDDDAKRRPLDLRNALALLESVRRQLISKGQWSKHGKRI